MKKVLFGFLIFCCCACDRYADRIFLSAEQPVLPVLTMKETNPLFKLTFVRQDSTDYVIREFRFSTEGTTDIGDLNRIGVFRANRKGMIVPSDSVGTVNVSEREVVLSCNEKVTTDTLVLWVSAELKNEVDLSHRIGVMCTEIGTDAGKVRLPDSLEVFPLRAGVAVHQHNQDGVHTARIPGLATSGKGTLLAIYDARRESARDLQGDMDIALNRSTDGGMTWQPMQVILDQKEWGGLPEKYNGVSDACILVDDKSGDIYVAGLWMYGVLDPQTGKWINGLTADSTRWNHQWRARGSQPGWDVKETAQFLITKSTDDGLTWGEPVNITRQTKKRDWWLFAPAPGHGITLSDGTLVFPTQGRDESGKPFSNMIWSRDSGKNWTAAAPAHDDVTECMAVELSDGSVLLNMRDNRNRGNLKVNGRSVFVTRDLGQNWTEHPTSRKTLIEPTCMASIHRHVYHDGEVEKSVLLFVNPESRVSRDHITLKVSFDDGNTWPEERKILLDEYSGRGYSCITSVDERRIGILYESSQADLVFQQVALDEILGSH